MRRLFAALLCLLLLSGCAAPTAEKAHWAMDTYVQISLGGTDARTGAEAVCHLLDVLEAQWSPVDSDSFLSKYNRGEVEPTGEQRAVLDKAAALAERTGGAFDPKLQELISLWGFLSKEYAVPGENAIQAALGNKKWNLGAALKGYAGDTAVALLEQMDISWGLLSLGGNIQTFGEKPDGSPWRVAIKDPKGEGYAGVLEVTDTASVVTSGGYQRYFEENGKHYHHILDPKTGYPAESGLASVTVIARDGMTADALSTAFYVMGLEKAAEHWRQYRDFEAVFILSGGEIYATQGAALTDCEFEVIRHEN